MIYSSTGPMIYSTLATDYIKMTHQIIYNSYLCKVASYTILIYVKSQLMIDIKSQLIAITNK